MQWIHETDFSDDDECTTNNEYLEQVHNYYIPYKLNKNNIISENNIENATRISGTMTPIQEIKNNMECSLPVAYRKRDTSKRHPIWVYENKVESTQIELFRTVLSRNDLITIKNRITTKLVNAREDLNTYIKTDEHESSEMTAQGEYAEGMQTSANDKCDHENSKNSFPKVTYLCEFLKEDDVTLFSYGTRVNYEARADQQVSKSSCNNEIQVCTSASTHRTTSSEPMKNIPNSSRSTNSYPVDSEGFQGTSEFAYMTTVGSTLYVRLTYDGHSTRSHRS